MCQSGSDETLPGIVIPWKPSSPILSINLCKGIEKNSSVNKFIRTTEKSSSLCVKSRSWRKVYTIIAEFETILQYMVYDIL